MSKRQSNPRPADDGAGYFAYEGLDRVLHEKARLGILTALRTRAEGLMFGEIKELCSLTDGNLSRHLSVLQEAELVEVFKGQKGGRPLTLVRLSKQGVRTFDAYLAELQRVIQDAQTSIGGKQRRPDLPPGFQPA